jgi:3-oxoacyl-[acyl-carrier-protein] synthase-3
MSSDLARAELRFRNARLKGVVTTVGSQRVDFLAEAFGLGLSEAEAARLQRAVGLGTRYIARDGETTVDYCVASARRLLDGTGVSASSIQGVILVTQSPDYAAPSSAIAIQNALGMPVTSLAFDMRLGCSGFVYGLAMASSLVESGLSRVLLCVGDIASRFVDPADHTIAPLMGDAGSAILLEREPAESHFQLYSDGSGARALIIPNTGLRHVPADEGLPSLMKMDGAAVFNFTLQRVPSMISDILAFGQREASDVDYFVLHQPNRYILRNLQKRMQLPEERVPTATQSVFGNQNSASIPGTINGFLSEPFSSRELTSVFAGFGIGLSWAAAIVNTRKIHAPRPYLGIDGHTQVPT